jgi:hypothetical protein
MTGRQIVWKTNRTRNAPSGASFAIPDWSEILSGELFVRTERDKQHTNLFGISWRNRQRRNRLARSIHPVGYRFRGHLIEFKGDWPQERDLSVNCDPKEGEEVESNDRRLLV